MAKAVLTWAAFMSPIPWQHRYGVLSQENALGCETWTLLVLVSASDTGANSSGSFDWDMCRSPS